MGMRRAVVTPVDRVPHTPQARGSLPRPIGTLSLRETIEERPIVQEQAPRITQKGHGDTIHKRAPAAH